jgi:ribosomal protein S18 acetylase RimI-like enzyme
MGPGNIAYVNGGSNTPALRLYESIGFRVVNRNPEYISMEEAYNFES